MKNLLFLTGISVLLAGACNSTRDGVSSTPNTTTRNEASTTPANRSTMPADADSRTGTYPAPAERDLDPNMRSTTDPNSRSTTDPNMRSTTDPNMRSTTDPNMGSTSDMNSRSTTDPNSRSTTDMNSRSTTDLNNRTGMTTHGMSTEHSAKGTLSSADVTNPSKVLETANTYGGLTKIPVSLATQVIDGYINKLAGMSGANALVSDLTMVKTQLNSANIDGAKVGEALKRLGTQTQALATGDAAYKSLGMALEQTGKMLSSK